MTGSGYSVGRLPARPKPIHCVGRRTVIEAIVPNGTFKYRSRMTIMSVAYADIAPELAMTLLDQLSTKQ